MKTLFYFFTLCFLLITRLAAGQNVQGIVFDPHRQPVEGVAVVLQTLDSVYVDAVITDSQGQFLIQKPIEKPHRLLFQHLLYEACLMEIASAEVGEVLLKEKSYDLNEVVVKGERPVVRVEGAALAYDIPQLIKDKTVNTAFEAIKELPGIHGMDDTLELIGAGSLHIIINGQLTTMSLPQLIQLLKTMPASRVKKAEVLYNAPAKYNVKGALINVILDQPAEEHPVFQGEAGSYYEQKHYALGGVHANLLYATPRLSVDLLVDAQKGRMYSGEDMTARHTLNKAITEIEQTGRNTTRNQEGTVRLGVDYTFINKDKLSAAYYLAADKSKAVRHSLTGFAPQEDEQTPWTSISRGDTKNHSTLQNVRLQYDGHRGLTIGGDYTGYHDPSTLYFKDKIDNQSVTDLLNNSEQDISRYSLFANQSHTLGSWELNYGIQGSYAVSDNYIEYLYNTGKDYELHPQSIEDNTQKDYAANVFADVSHVFNSRFSVNAAMKVEYYKSDYRKNEEQTTLWNAWALFPTLSMSYTFSPQHILQLHVNSDKTYPTYWNLSPQRYPLNSYSVVEGNPSLKPYRTYNMQWVYILRQKYMFLTFCNYAPDYFTQVPYQSDAEMKNVFRYENFNYSLKTGIAVILPFRVGSFWNSRFTLQGFRMQEKSDHFHTMSFNREAYVAAVMMNHTFNLSHTPNLKLTVDGQYVTPGAIQGLYDLGFICNISAGLKWTFADERASLTLKVDDIFRHGYPDKIEIKQDNQWNKMTKVNDMQAVRLTFVYKFGGYKEKAHDKVDTSRFGQ
ncbi:TonB-dependent receptor [Parabacteroides sp. 52]|uniref:outer membrane beta-barrel protein n=1 Tax=unclassified Parabacteroides TaxID=2649774 RepID=UPI0013D7D2D7|nr:MULTISPECIES: outer membrane beta-barrel protein [unclassified Parabacteroides]MDH6533704.1 hypothetical protein [Parabacteroides sp. PM5-20]NDV54456.1 TonB-dependent receptor [Parabacteroides sp. 52]